MELVSSRKYLFLLFITLFVSFVFFSYLVSQELFTQLDFDLTVKIQDRVPPSWNLPFSLFSLFGSIEIIGLAWLGLLLWATLNRYWLTIAGLFLLVAIQIIEVLGKTLLLHPGPPFLFYKGVKIITFPSHFVQTDYSYPSGHSTRTAFLLTFLFVLATLKLKGFSRLLAQFGLIFFLAIMLLSRVSLGEHWATDVVGGALLGGAAGLLAAATIPNPRFKQT